MNLFYSPVIQFPCHLFNREESGHMVRVLRLKEGDKVHLTNGQGTLAEGTILVADPKQCEISLHSPPAFIPRNTHSLHIALAPTKNIGRFEWFLEKATEIGIDAITPLLCDRSERTVVNTDRFQKVVIAAMKQSLKTWLPTLHEPQRFTDFIRTDFPGQQFIAHCETGQELLLQKVYKSGESVRILIGPEGDFSPEEVTRARKAGFIPVSLGGSRLRTETAGIVACTVFNLTNSPL